MRIQKLTAVWLISLVNIIYATLRYVVFGPEHYLKSAVFVLNKAISLSALFFLIIAVLSKQLNQIRLTALTDGKFYGKLSLVLLVIHSVVSFILLDVSHYPKLYRAIGELNLNGWISIISGTLATILLVRYQLHYKTNRFQLKKKSIILIIALILIGFHILGLGWSNWFAPTTWYGYLPPISMLSFLVLVVGLYVNQFCKT